MKIENINEWIYYYFIKDEEALPTLMEHFSVMVNNLYKAMVPNELMIAQEYGDYESIAYTTLIDCLHRYRFDSPSNFYTYYYMCLKRNFIDSFRVLKRLFPSDIFTISFDMKIREDNNMYYHDLYSNNGITSDQYVIEKCETEYWLNRANKELRPMDYEILKMKHDGYTVRDICLKYGVSKQFVYYRLKKIRNWFTSH